MRGETMPYITVGQAADSLNQRHGTTFTAKDISTTIYCSRVMRCVPVVCGRRMLSDSDVATLESELRRANKLPTRRATNAR